MKRSKIIAIGLACLFFGSILSAIATRTITDSNDTIYTMVTNSKGNSWTVTRANVQAAIDDLDTVGFGTVYVGGSLAMDGTPIYPHSNCTIDFQGNKVTFSSGGEFINFTKYASYSYGVRYATVRNANVYPTQGQKRGVITFYIPVGAASVTHTLRYNTVEDITIYGDSGEKEYYGIYMDIRGESSICGNVIRNIKTYWAGTGINLSATSNANTAWGNMNIFENIYIDYYRTMVDFNQGAGVIPNKINFYNYNTFKSVCGQAVEAAPYSSKYTFKNIAGAGNSFYDCMGIDFESSTLKVYDYEISSKANDTFIQTRWISPDYFSNRGVNTHVKTQVDGTFDSETTVSYIIGYNTDTDDTYNIFLKDGRTGQVYRYYTNLNSALDAAWDMKTTRSCEILILRGTYWVNTSIANDYMYKTKLRGQGPYATILKQGAAASTGILRLYSSTTRIQDIEICDLQIYGQDEVGAYDGPGIRIQNGYNITLRNVCIRDTNDEQLLIYHTAGSSRNIQAIDCDFYEQDTSCIVNFYHSSGTYVSDVSFTNCFFHEISGNIFYQEGAGYMNRVSIEDNDFLNCTNNLYYMPATATYINSFKFNDNIVTNCGTTATATYGGIWLRRNATDIQINDNIFNWTANPANAIRVVSITAANTYDCRGISVCGNIIDGNGPTGVIYANVDQGVYLSGTSAILNMNNLTVCNNVIHAGDEAIYLDYANNTIVDGNVCSGDVDAIDINTMGHATWNILSDNIEWTW